MVKILLSEKIMTASKMRNTGIKNMSEMNDDKNPELNNETPLAQIKE